MSETPMKKQALLIGINKYKILPELKYARQDAEAVADSLKQNYCFSDNEILLLTDDRPGLLEPTDKYTIKDHLEELANQELDLFIFGFWGHGLFRNGQRYLCPLNVKSSRADQQGLSFDDLQECLYKIHSKNTCMILDCCQTVHDRGEAETLTFSDQTSMENAARDIVLKRKSQIPNFQSNVAILNSCKEGQSAYEWDARQHGLFTAYLLEAMKKQNNSVMHIAQYISQNIKKTALELGKEQTPFYKLEGDILLPVAAKPTSPKFVLPPRSKDAVIEKPVVEDINVSFTPGQIERQQPIQYDKIQLPPLPETLINIQAENKGRENAIAQLQDFTHESLSQANAAVAKAQAQFDAWSERKERLWKDLTREVQQSLQKTISSNPKCTEVDIKISTDNMSNQEYFDLLERFQCGKKYEQARLELERVLNERKQKCDDVIKEFQQKIKSENAKVEEIRTQFMDEVLLSILAVMPGFDNLEVEFPDDIILEPLRLLDKYELGWRAPAEIARARFLWDEQRPCVLESKPDLSLSGRNAGERAVTTVNDVEFAFRWAPAGTFMMGSPTSEDGRSGGETQHSVTLTKGFWMMETEVTVGMFKAFVSDTGYESKGNMPYGWTGSTWEQNSKYSWRNPGFNQDDSHPVTCVSWNDAVEFCKWLGKKTGQNITLPTEAQWEYSCRAGTTGAYAGNLDEMAWYTSNSGSKTHPVGIKKPNAWGLFDIHGNVWEWCQDWYGDYPSGSVTNPTGLSSGSYRVIRGGGWYDYARYCRSAYRSYSEPDSRVDDLGFRVVRGQ